MKDYTSGVLLTVALVFLVIWGGYLSSVKNMPGDRIELTKNNIEVCSVGTISIEKEKNNKSSKNGSWPSAIAIHPKSEDIFVFESPNQRIVVLSVAGKPKYYLAFDKHTFPQMFKPSGDFYISTEGVKQKASIGKMNIVLD